MKKTSLTLAFFITISLNAKIPEVLLFEKARFDTIIDGKPVSLYTITNGTITAQITNYGGYVVSIFTPDKENVYHNLVTGYDNIHPYPFANCGQIGPALGRFANRIANGTFTIDNITYNVTKNSGAHTLHGGNNGFDRTVWSVEKIKKNSVTMSCVLPDGTDGFPGNLKTTLTYSITKENGLSIDYKAKTDKPTVINLSNHTFFNLNGNGQGDIFDHILTIFSDSITELDRNNIPTGKILPISGTAYDFSIPEKIGERIGISPIATQQQEGLPAKVRSFDINYVLNHTKPDKIELVATLYSPLSGRTLEVLNNHPGLQLYTGARTAIALESQMYPDSPNHKNFPSTLLRPGETYKHTCIYRFSNKTE